MQVERAAAGGAQARLWVNVTRGRRIATQAFDRYRFASMLLGLLQSIADLVRTHSGQYDRVCPGICWLLVGNNGFIPVRSFLMSATALTRREGRRDETS
jgi:hypothetical protein